MHQQVHRAIAEPGGDYAPDETFGQRDQNQQAAGNGDQQPRSGHFFRRGGNFNGVANVLRVISWHFVSSPSLWPQPKQPLVAAAAPRHGADGPSAHTPPREVDRFLGCGHLLHNAQNHGENRHGKLRICPTPAVRELSMTNNLVITTCQTPHPGRPRCVTHSAWNGTKVFTGLPVPRSTGRVGADFTSRSKSKSDAAREELAKRARSAGPQPPPSATYRAPGACVRVGF
jgi:hypothetical protein